MDRRRLFALGLVLGSACTRGGAPAGDVAPPSTTSAPVVSAPPLPVAAPVATPSVATVDAAPSGTDIPENAELRLERTVCYGVCPAYSVTLRPDGRVTYRGDAFVRVFGPATRTVDAKKARALFERLEADGAWTWSTEYRAPITDHPTQRITITWGTRKKTIEEYASCPGGAPAGLCALEKDIDDVAGAASWTTCGGGYCPRSAKGP